MSQNAPKEYNLRTTQITERQKGIEVIRNITLTADKKSSVKQVLKKRYSSAIEE